MSSVPPPSAPAIPSAAIPSAAQAAVRADFTARKEAADAAVAEAVRAEGRLANGRLGVFAVGLLMIWPVAVVDAFSSAWLLVPAAAFVTLVARHVRIQRLRAAHERRAQLYADGLARIAGTWAGTGPDGVQFLAKAHPYTEHLDVFGRGSLFQLLCRARTSAGRRCLAAWLGAAAPGAAIRARQAAVAELAPRVDLREDIALLGDAAGDASAVSELPAWGEAQAVLGGGPLRIVALVLPAISLAVIAACVVAGETFGRSLLYLLPFLVVEWGFYRLVRERVSVVLAAGEVGARQLVVVAGLLERLERETVTAPRLLELEAELCADGVRASERIAQLQRLIEGLEWRENQVFTPFALLLLWPVQFAFAIEAWRKTSGPSLAAWFDALAEFEALLSLSGHAHEHPDDPFPEIVEDELVVAGQALAHPLLPETRAVPNDITLDDARRVYVISGSNMSGKSTCLRTVGTNVILALAGAPVRAQSLRVSPVALGASIHVHDSLLDGESRFYAEVSRIGQIVHLADGGALPLLFLLDELFHGTNSSDRRVGAAAVVRTLLERGALGLLTTHDLELARLAEDLGKAVVNVHFEDRFEDGRMSFDYRMRPGMVERSNALALMRAVGLDV